METRDYIESCKEDFWKSVFEQETKYLCKKLIFCKDILSVGCGPAVIEGDLCKCGFNVTGLDVSQEALNEAPAGVRTIVGSAEQTSIPDSSFDGVIYVASLQFIDDYQKALRDTERILKPGGIFLAMLLNPKSFFFQEKRRDAASYINKIKHTDSNEIERTISRLFIIEKTEYFLGIRGKELFHTNDPGQASLYCIKARKKPIERP
jgi:ubiquinone/menaquinone biosynthesis C-methylase UbiE